jgi:hypothetical protein
MLQEAARLGIDVEQAGAKLCMDALHETITVQTSGDGLRPPTAAELLRREIEKDAEAIAQIINSPHVPEAIKHALSERVLEYMDSFNEHADVLRAQLPLAVLRDMHEADAQQ